MRQYINRQKLQNLIKQKLLENYKKRILIKEADNDNNTNMSVLFNILFPTITDNNDKADNTIKQSLFLESIYELFDNKEYVNISKKLNPDDQTALLSLSQKLKDILDNNFFKPLEKYVKSDGTTTLSLEGFNTLVQNVKSKIGQENLNIPNSVANLLDTKKFNNIITADHLNKIKQGIENLGITIIPSFKGNDIILPVNHISGEITAKTIVGLSQKFNAYTFAAVGVKAQIQSAITQYLTQNRESINQQKNQQELADQFTINDTSFISYNNKLNYENFNFESFKLYAIKQLFSSIKESAFRGKIDDNSFFNNVNTKIANKIYNRSGQNFNRYKQMFKQNQLNELNVPKSDFELFYNNIKAPKNPKSFENNAHNKNAALLLTKQHFSECYSKAVWTDNQDIIFIQLLRMKGLIRNLNEYIEKNKNSVVNLKNSVDQPYFFDESEMQNDSTRIKDEVEKIILDFIDTVNFQEIFGNKLDPKSDLKQTQQKQEKVPNNDQQTSVKKDEDLNSKKEENKKEEIQTPVPVLKKVEQAAAEIKEKDLEPEDLRKEIADLKARLAAQGIDLKKAIEDLNLLRKQKEEADKVKVVEEVDEKGSVNDIFKIPQLNGGYKQLAKILTSSSNLLDLKAGTFKRGKYDTAKAYGYLLKNEADIGKVADIFQNSYQVIQSLKLGPTIENQLKKGLVNSAVTGKYLADYYDQKTLLANEYLLLDGSVFMYLILRHLENAGLNSTEFNKLHQKFVVNKDPKVIKASAKISPDMLSQVINLKNRISISQLLANRNRNQNTSQGEGSNIKKKDINLGDYNLKLNANNKINASQTDFEDTENTEQDEFDLKKTQSDVDDNQDDLNRNEDEEVENSPDASE